MTTTRRQRHVVVLRGALWFALLLWCSLSIFTNIRALRCINPTAAMTFFAGHNNDDDYNGDNRKRSKALPSVACFFMIRKETIDGAMSVRYSHWGKRCDHFVIFTNGVSGDGEMNLDSNTVLVDIHRVIESELRARRAMTTTGSDTVDADAEPKFANILEAAEYSKYTTFPPPRNEIKEYLALKSFYSWLYMARNYGHIVDYVMKADPDTYMLMDNYLRYLAEYHTPHHPVYIGRVFKTEGNMNDPFVTGLSTTLSKATLRLLLATSTIRSDHRDHHECSAERFRHGREADDHTLAQCLRSMGVYPAYTRDELGRELFLHFSPTQHYRGGDDEPRWHANFSFTPYGHDMGCCSQRACAFHYVGVEKQNSTLYWSDFTHAWHWKRSG